MTPELKQKWIEALRSGEYQQTQKILRDGQGFCCLGVLCDISDIGMWDETNNYYEVPDGDGITEYLQGDLYILGPDTFGVPNEIEAGCIALNDNEGATFNQIANWLENHL